MDDVSKLDVSETAEDLNDEDQKGKGMHIHRISVTEDGSITILASPTSPEGSVIHEINAKHKEGVIMCRVDMKTIKKAMDARRKWSLHYRQSHTLSFKPRKHRVKSLMEEIGELPRPNWSYVEIIPRPEDDGAVVPLPIQTPLSSPHLYVVSGSSFVPLLLSEDNYGVTSDTTTSSVESSEPDSSLLSHSGPHYAIPPPPPIKKSVEKPIGPVCDSHLCFSDKQSVKYLQSAANSCVVYKVLENGLLEIGLQSYANCLCTVNDSRPFFGPWVVAIKKHLVDKMEKCEFEWKKNAKMRGPTWPPETVYRVKTSANDDCLTAAAGSNQAHEVLEYIMDTNKEKFHSEAPITVRLAWFMEKQLKKTSLVSSALDWSSEDVNKWLATKVGLPQYQACFEANGIRGSHLVLLDAEALEKMGIRDFDHILKITSSIREMLKTKREKNVWREVTEARYDPFTLYSIYNYRRIAKRLPVHDFFIDHHFVDRKVPNYSLFEIKKHIWNVFPRTVRRAEPLTYFAKDIVPRRLEGNKNYQIISKW